MELETINGIKNIDLDSVSLKDVSNIISEMSVDAGFNDNAKTILYSGKINGYKTGDIAKSLDNVRIIDNTDVGKFLSGNKFDELLEAAITNDIKNCTLDVSLIEKALDDNQLKDLKKYLDAYNDLSQEQLIKAVQIASDGYKYEPTKGAWAIASEQFIKATPSSSEIICLTAEADLTRIWAQVEIPTALKHLPDKQVFGGYTIAELKSVYNSNGIESVQNLLKNKAINSLFFYKHK